MKGRYILRKLLLVLSILMILTSSVQGTLAFLVVKTDPVTNIFIPVRFGSFILDKSVEHELNDGYVIPDNIVFDFDIELGTYYGNKAIITNYGSYNTDANGKFSVGVRPGASLIINDLTEGTVIKVTETTVLPGFEIKDGVATHSVTVNKDGNVKIQFVNVYTPEAVRADNITLTGKKILSGRPWKEGDSFTFVLDMKDGDSWKNLSQKTVSYDANASEQGIFNFNDVISVLSFEKVGDYSFRIYELEGDIDRVDYDRTVNEFKIVVTDKDMDGYLEIDKVTASQKATVSFENNVYDINVTFDNTYIPPRPDDISVIIKAKKTLAGSGAGRFSPDDFSIMLEGNGDKYSLNPTNGYAAFSLDFSADDIGNEYEYTLYEPKGSLDGVTYSEKIYTVKVKITLSDENTLVADVTVTSGGIELQDGEEIEFINIIAELPPPTGDNTAMYLWGAVFIAGVALLIFVIFAEKRNPITR